MKLMVDSFYFHSVVDAAKAMRRVATARERKGVPRQAGPVREELQAVEPIGAHLPALLRPCVQARILIVIGLRIGPRVQAGA